MKRSLNFEFAGVTKAGVKFYGRYTHRGRGGFPVLGFVVFIKDNEVLDIKGPQAVPFYSSIGEDVEGSIIVDSRINTEDVPHDAPLSRLEQFYTNSDCSYRRYMAVSMGIKEKSYVSPLVFYLFKQHKMALLEKQSLRGKR